MPLAVLAQRLELGQALDRRARFARSPVSAMPSAFCSVRIGERRAGVRLEGGWSAASLSAFFCARRSAALAGHAGEHLGDMADADRRPCALELAGHVEQAAEIAGEQRVGAGRRDIRGLVAHHLVGDLRILDAERAAEAAAHFGARQLGELRPVDRAQEKARLLLDAELAQARAGIVIGRGAVIARGDAAHPLMSVRKETSS